MKSKIWLLIYVVVILLSIGSFLFVFEENKIDPRLWGVPYIFWTGFLIMVVIVGLTFLASRFFPNEESNTNAQIFALGTELRSLLSGSDKSNMRITQVAILVFTLIVLVFSAYMSDKLVLLAIVSFAGTSMIAPVVLGAVIFKHPSKSLLVVSALALAYFVLSLIEWIPASFAGLPTDAELYSILIPMSAIILVWHHFTQNLPKKSSMTLSYIRKDDYNPCEDSMWPLKIKSYTDEA